MKVIKQTFQEVSLVVVFTLTVKNVSSYEIAIAATLLFRLNLSGHHAVSNHNKSA